MNLLINPSPTSEGLKTIAAKPYEGPKIFAPEPGSELEDTILYYVVALYLNIEPELCRDRIRSIFEPAAYNLLIIFLAYNHTALTWAECHPEISYQDDKRVQTHLENLLMSAWS